MIERIVDAHLRSKEIQKGYLPLIIEWKRHDDRQHHRHDQVHIQCPAFEFVGQRPLHAVHLQQVVKCYTDKVGCNPKVKKENQEKQQGYATGNKVPVKQAEPEITFEFKRPEPPKIDHEIEKNEVERPVQQSQYKQSNAACKQDSFSDWHVFRAVAVFFYPV